MLHGGCKEIGNTQERAKLGQVGARGSRYSSRQDGEGPNSLSVRQAERGARGQRSQEVSSPLHLIR